MPGFLAEALTQPRNYHIRLALRTAQTNKVLPHYLLLTGQEKLNKLFIRKLDAALMMAMQVLKDETCPNCGVVHWLGHAEDNNIQWKENEVTCFSCAEKAVKDRAHAKKKDNSDDGVTRYLEPVAALKEMPLPGREAHQQRVYKERLAELEKELNQ